MVWALLLPTLFYVALIGGIAVWASRRRPLSPPPPSPREWPRVAVLVAARNEEDRLPRCLDALLAQDYPVDRLDLFIADDHSTDGTAAVIRHYRERAGRALAVAGGIDEEPPFYWPEPPPLPAVHAVPVPLPEGHLRGKALAIHAAVEACDHDLLLVTDADCAPPPGWVRSLVRYFEDPDVGVACGHTLVDSEAPGVPRSLAEVQALDWTFLLTACSFMVETGRPVTAMGNNMAFRRSAYEAVGGYPALPFSVTEDYVLFKTIVERTPWQARFPMDPALYNVTLPLSNLRDVYGQRRRWARGGLWATAREYAVFTIVHLAHLGPLVALAFAPGPALAALGLKLTADFGLLWGALGRGGRRDLLRAFPLWEGGLFAYMATLPATLVLRPRISWKDRQL